MAAIKYLRVFLRALAALFWTIVVHFCWIRVVQLFRPGKRCLDALSAWGKGLAFIMGIRLEKVNAEAHPMGDMIISNHMGFLDIPAMLSCFPGVFIIKVEMKNVFFFGKPLVHQGHVFVDRSSMGSRRRAREEMLQVLRDGDRIIIFPEGKATPDASRPPFAAAPFAAAEQLGKTVQPCVIDYLPDRGILKWDVEKPMFGQLVELFGRRRIDMRVEFFPPEKVSDARASARTFHDLIQGRLEQHDREREAAAASQG